MDARFQRLLDAFRQVVQGPPRDLRAWIERLPESGALPSPWETWTLIGLVPHRKRQLWVGDMVRTRLRGALDESDPLSQMGSLPGLPEWEYFFHGIGCRISHKVRGDAIDVDFWGGSAEYFDTYFYTNFLESLRSPEPPEQRLRELHRSSRPVRLAINDLITAGALTTFGAPARHRSCISEEVLEYQDDIDDFVEAWAAPDLRLWLSALAGDWLAVHDLASEHSAIEQIAAPRKDQCCLQHRDRLLQETGFDAADALFGLAELNAADEVLERAFHIAPCAFYSDPQPLLSAALQIVGERNDGRWCPQIFALFSGLNRQGQHPDSHIWATALNYLLHHNHRTNELLTSLPHAGAGVIGEAALVALERAPEHALPLIRKGLLAAVSMDRTFVASILVLIRKRWCIQELIRALKESDDQERTATARAAILELRDPEAEKAVVEWKQKNPRDDDVGTYLENSGRKLGPSHLTGPPDLNSPAIRIPYLMEKLYDRVMKIRNVITADAP